MSSLTTREKRNKREARTIAKELDNFHFKGYRQVHSSVLFSVHGKGEVLSMV